MIYSSDSHLFSPTEQKQERTILLKLHLTAPLSNLWASSADHCTWFGVTCEEDWENKTESWFHVTELDFNNTSWNQAYFQEFSGLTKLEVLRTNQNSLSGSVPDDLCSPSSHVFIVGDETNCPNILTEVGCCDEVKLTVPSSYLDGIVAAELGSADCSTLDSVSDRNTCAFMKLKDNHVIFQVDEMYPSREDFPFDTWLKERTVLAQVFYGTSLETENPAWLDTGDHCSWTGVTCSSQYQVTSLSLNGLGLTGPYPSTLGKLDSLTSLVTIGNDLTGPLTVNEDICINSYIAGDETNCPNAVDESGCCDIVRMTNPSPYIDEIVTTELGSAECSSLSSSDEKVCEYMRNKSNHYVFEENQYPTGFPYASWLKVSKRRLCIVYIFVV